MIKSHDVLQVAKQIEVNLTQLEVQYILEAYPYIESQLNWSEIVENLIYNIESTKELAQCLRRAKYLKNTLSSRIEIY
jgi:hypothetical protein